MRKYRIPIIAAAALVWFAIGATPIPWLPWLWLPLVGALALVSLALAWLLLSETMEETYLRRWSQYHHQTRPPHRPHL